MDLVINSFMTILSKLNIDFISITGYPGNSGMDLSHLSSVQRLMRVKYRVKRLTD